MTEVCRAKSAQGPYADRDGKDCAENKDGETDRSGTTLLESHSPDEKGDYEVLAPGSVGIVVRPLYPFLCVLNLLVFLCLHLPYSCNSCTNSDCGPFLGLTSIKQETTEGLLMTTSTRTRMPQTLSESPLTTDTITLN